MNQTYMLQNGKKSTNVCWIGLRTLWPHSNPVCRVINPLPPPTALSEVGNYGTVLSFDTPYHTELPPYSPKTEIENWVNMCHRREWSLMFTVHYSLFGPKSELFSVYIHYSQFTIHYSGQIVNCNLLYNSLFAVDNSLFGPNSEL